MRGWKNPALAWTVALVILVGSTLFSAHHALSAWSAQVASVYQNGVEGDGLGIAGDLAARLEDSYNLVVVARRYLPEEGAIADVLYAREALSSAQGPAAQSLANDALTEAVTALYQALEAEPLTDKDETYRRGLYADLSARNQTIRNDGYNALAQEFNAVLEEFPAGLLAGLTGIAPAEYFQ